MRNLLLRELICPPEITDDEFGLPRALGLSSQWYRRKNEHMQTTTDY